MELKKGINVDYILDDIDNVFSDVTDVIELDYDDKYYEMYKSLASKYKTDIKDVIDPLNLSNNDLTNFVYYLCVDRESIKSFETSDDFLYCGVYENANSVEPIQLFYFRKDHISTAPVIFWYKIVSMIICEEV